MNTAIICSMLFAFSVGTIVWFLNRLHISKKRQKNSMLGTHQNNFDALELSSQLTEVSKLPDYIVIGEHQHNPVVTIKLSRSIAEYQCASPVALNGGLIARLSVLLQAAPSMLIAAEASGKQLMEVCINGGLTRAADGNGYRAFAMASGKVSEHARLFEVDKLGAMINGAAIWQIASVLVAQKHLADINKKLDEIKDAILGISQFLDNQRKARLQSTFQYLRQVAMAISNGELSASVRNQLENCERDLLEIQIHLESEYRQNVEQQPKKDTVGTEDLTNSLSNKLGRVDIFIYHYPC